MWRNGGEISGRKPILSLMASADNLDHETEPEAAGEAAKAGQGETEDDLPELLPASNNRAGFIRKCVSVVCGLVLLILGLLGILLPGIPGTPAFLIGLAMVSVASDRLRRWINYRDTRLSRKWRLFLRRFQHRKSDSA